MNIQKLIGIGIIAISVLSILTGITLSEHMKEPVGQPDKWLDPISNCYYLVFPSGAVTPWLNGYGNPICIPPQPAVPMRKASNNEVRYNV